MSSNDSFIDEVSDEVRRDRLFAYMRRYGWIAVLAVLAIVGAAAWSEWSKAQARAEAETLGDALLTALETEDDAARAAALAAVPASGDARAVAALLTATEQETAGDLAAAVTTLRRVAEDAALPQAYRDLAQIKALMIGEGVIDAAERRTGLEAMAVPGRPYRMIALEQLALMTLATGDRAGAIAAFEALTVDAEASEGLRGRARDMIVALGGGAVPAEEAGAAPMMVGDETAPVGAEDDDAANGDIVIDDTATVDAAPDDATPGDAAPDDATPDDATPDEATPDDATPTGE